LFLCLVARRVSGQPIHDLTLSLSVRRLTIFGFLHLSLIFLSNWLGSWDTGSDVSHQGLPLAAAKLLVFLPTAALLDKETWQRLFRHFRPELLASGLAFLTYFPFRIFVDAWPVYSALLARTVHFLGTIFVAGLGYVPGASPTITGPVLDVHILFGCSGLDGLRLFQVLFSSLLVCDWDRLRRWRTLTGYGAGLALMLLANAIRIAAMVVIGNRISADLVVRYHLEAGWVYVTTVFLLLLLVSYRWLITPAADDPPIGTHPQTQIQ
jgi:exosortase/archaeosortase family protein